MSDSPRSRFARVFLLGLALGGVLSAVPACQSPVLECGPATCPSGCCQDGQCVTNQGVGSCGIAGELCKVCGAGESCTAGLCKAQPDAGSGGAGGAGGTGGAAGQGGVGGGAGAGGTGGDPDGGMCKGCLGCCDTTTGSCVNFQKLTDQQCGVLGRACVDCGAGRCNFGFCRDPDAGQQLPFDGGLPWLDGGLPWLDGGFPWLDGGLPWLDGGFPFLDGGFSFPDGGFTIPDGGFFGPCTLTSCTTGCCLSSQFGDVCVPFNFQGQFACGALGTQCVACASPKVCQLGVCH